MKPIPISAAKSIAEKYEYDQVIIIGRKTGDGGGEHCTTYGVSKEHCGIAARCGEFLKFKVMGWHQPAAADQLQSFNEYRAHGGRLDLVGWEEKEERDSV